MIEVRAATLVPEHAEAVLAQPGDSRTCWCQWFRATRREFDEIGTEARRERFREQVRVDGPGPGLVAFRDGEPVGWCAVAPRGDYPVVGRSRLFGSGAAAPGTWVVTCFVVAAGHRRRGVARALLEAAVEHARANGAAAVEASPVDVDAKVDPTEDELYHGALPLFTARGFEVVARPSATRALVRLPL